jgi:hypothetical protein
MVAGVGNVQTVGSYTLIYCYCLRRPQSVVGNYIDAIVDKVELAQNNIGGGVGGWYPRVTQEHGGEHDDEPGRRPS